MPDPGGRRRSTEAPAALRIGLAAVIAFFVIGGAVAYWNLSVLTRNFRLTTRTHDVLVALGNVLTLIKDAESEQRAFIITGERVHFDLYNAALSRLDVRLSDLQVGTADNADHQTRLPALREAVDRRRRQLAEVVAARGEGRFDQGRAQVGSDQARAAMDAIRAQIDAMERTERDLRATRLDEVSRAHWVAISGALLTTLLGLGVSTAVGALVQRSVRDQRRREWLQTGKVGLGAAVAGNQTPKQVGDGALKFLAEYLEAPAGALFTTEDDGLRRVATYGVPSNGGVPERVAPGDGLLGQAAKDRRTVVVRDLPDGYLTVGSALGRGKPRHLVVAPATVDGEAAGVMELGFVNPVDTLAGELLSEAAEAVGVALRAAAFREHLQKLLDETQRQAEELQAQSEELRVSNEELEEQGRALRESQARLEQQQAQLEQTNAHLEEQTQLLEAERDQVAKSRAALQSKARELAQASRYKSDFLANMSHELRTPLNSSLILAKLLADNPGGNLTDEQVRYAQTIHSAGNDLLALINDVLDLSRIEAGRMEVRPEPVPIAHLVEGLTRTFQPMADQKGLAFRPVVAPTCPDGVETDRQRLEQVLKNLLANAVKFTERGEVELSATRTADGRIAFAVRDTGVGIAVEHQEAIFEAFRQADGTTNRKFGGTGLGLSISRELTRLLGGEIGLESEPGRGSTFTVTLPLTYAAPPAAPPPPAAHAERSPLAALSAPPPAPAPKTPPHAVRRVADDREQLTGDRRVILVVEDDEPFARILYDLTRELGFQCLIATTAEEGLAAATQYQPNAVVLDVGLPDHSGLSVLDRLKHDARTRHIPVHVVSAADHAETALALGAVGYLVKPVKREQLADALGRLEDRLERRLRRVLIVEDDPRQRESLQALLGASDVETVGAATAAECLERLKSETFDCMVLDLSLPDASGYSLLETLSAGEAYSFPPVIVYTGRELSRDDEQRLRRFSKSIIIKGARSPERLLDEVTLFLHQVVAEMPPERRRMLERARSRDAALEGRRILVVEDDVRNVFALTSILEPRGASVEIARNGREALQALERADGDPARRIDLVLMDVMMPEMDGLTATREIRRRDAWKRLPVIALTAKAMKDDQEQCLAAGANDYMAKPLDVEKLLSLVRVWMPR
jgi:CheY-like chemotaxis protein/signal transduction histidine kinase/CHASE3 domain sensor protein